MSKSTIEPYLGLATGIVAVSFASIFIRLAEAPSLVIAAGRLTIASLILAPAALIRGKEELRALTKGDLQLALLSGLFLGVGIKLVDFKVEFGRLWENDYMRIVLADEISPDCCRLWDAATSDKLDKDRFRRDLGGVLEAYSEVARRLGILPESGQGEAKGPMLVK